MNEDEAGREFAKLVMDYETNPESVRKLAAASIMDFVTKLRHLTDIIVVAAVDDDWALVTCSVAEVHRGCHTVGEVAADRMMKDVMDERIPLREAKDAAVRMSEMMNRKYGDASPAVNMETVLAGIFGVPTDKLNDLIERMGDG